ncbi:MAG: DUF2807 domain-containing protein [Bacteroidales bacterium]|nr:DUF2807 domain-containing protein [Bacteroidales bacterium]MCF8458164.1 DUF2807 domain-containing protein [Bacteroidales bacterium]
MKKNKIVLFGLLAITLLLANSCEDPWFNCIRGNGDVSEELRNVGDFSAIDSEGDFEVFVSIGPTTDVVVEAESNLLDYIETDVRNGKLTIDTRRNRCLRNEEPMRIFITTPHLNDIELDGSGFIECEGIVSSFLNVDLNGSGDIRLGAEAEFIDADISGSGEIELWGTAHETEFKISGSGQIKSFDLISDKSFSTITGSGNIYVLAYDFLDVKITGSGNVYYKGNPGIHVNITGSGDLIHW